MSDQKIHQLKGPTTVKTFCGMLVERADEIERIAVVVEWKGKNGLTNTAYTEMSAEQAAWMDYCFRDQFMKDIMVANDDQD